VSEEWVVNASPLILFSRIDRLDLIEDVAPAILVPNAVIEEVRAGQHKDRTAARAMEWAGGYRVEDIAVAASIEHWDLGTGEAQVIAHCVDAPRWAVLDDRAACRCAAAHDVQVIGTLGVVLRAKNRGQVESARPLVKKLVAAGMLSAMSSWKPCLPASGNEAVMPQAHVGLFRTSCGHLTFFLCSLCCL
jgi:predicted nucleic acid-binding protein